MNTLRQTADALLDLAGALRATPGCEERVEALSRLAREVSHHADAAGRRATRPVFDDSGDDDLKDGGIGVPGFGSARDREPLP